MQYRNKRTGAIIDIPGIITGDVWERIEPKRKTEEPTETPEPTEDKAPQKRSKKK